MAACPQPAGGHAPLNFFYSHFHNSIKNELKALGAWVAQLERVQQDALLPKLQELRERYKFLEQIYKYHSSVEDEVRSRADQGAMGCGAELFGTRQRNEAHALPGPPPAGCLPCP